MIYVNRATSAHSMIRVKISCNTLLNPCYKKLSHPEYLPSKRKKRINTGSNIFQKSQIHVHTLSKEVIFCVRLCVTPPPTPEGLARELARCRVWTHLSPARPGVDKAHSGRAPANGPPLRRTRARPFSICNHRQWRIGLEVPTVSLLRGTQRENGLFGAQTEGVCSQEQTTLHQMMGVIM